MVWARGAVAIETCPVSYVTAESLAFLQEFHAWKLLGGADLWSLPARTAGAFQILEMEWRAEMNSEQQ